MATLLPRLKQEPQPAFRRENGIRRRQIRKNMCQVPERVNFMQLSFRTRQGRLDAQRQSSLVFESSEKWYIQFCNIHLQILAQMAVFFEKSRHWVFSLLS